MPRKRVKKNERKSAAALKVPTKRSKQNNDAAHNKMYSCRNKIAKQTQSYTFRYTWCSSIFIRNLRIFWIWQAAENVHLWWMCTFQSLRIWYKLKGTPCIWISCGGSIVANFIYHWNNLDHLFWCIQKNVMCVFFSLLLHFMESTDFVFLFLFFLTAKLTYIRW